MKHKKKRTFFEFLREVLFASQAEREFYDTYDKSKSWGSIRNIDKFFSGILEVIPNLDSKVLNDPEIINKMRNFQKAITDVKCSKPKDREKTLEKLKKAYVPLANNLGNSVLLSELTSIGFAQISANDKAAITAPLKGQER